MHMMLLSLLQGLHVFGQVGCSPHCGLHTRIQLVSRPTAHEHAVFELRPGSLYFIPLFFPGFFVAVDLPLDVARIAGAAAEHLQEPLLLQALQL